MRRCIILSTKVLARQIIRRVKGAKNVVTFGAIILAYTLCTMTILSCKVFIFIVKFLRCRGWNYKFCSCCLYHPSTLHIAMLSLPSTTLKYIIFSYSLDFNSFLRKSIYPVVFGKSFCFAFQNFIMNSN